jgi:L,D-transpeptidase ErfK/SrfK
MGLSKPHYGIHGTNNPPSIGTAASNGCIRMFNKDVEELFNKIPVNTIVRIF